jgi:hypothetical protein
MTSAVAGMFADYYRRKREQAVGAGATVGGGQTSPEGVWGRHTSRLVGQTSSRNGVRADRQRTAEPTTIPPETPGSMSSEHSFMATAAGAPPPPPPPPGGQPSGLPPYVPAAHPSAPERCSPAAGTPTRRRIRRRRGTRPSGDSAQAGRARVSPVPSAWARASEQVSLGSPACHPQPPTRSLRTMLTRRSLPCPQGE